MARGRSWRRRVPCVMGRDRRARGECQPGLSGTNTGVMTSLHERCFFFFSSRRRHTRLQGDWSSDVCSSDLYATWLRENSLRLEDLPEQPLPATDHAAVLNLQIAFGYTHEDLRILLAPMAKNEIGRASCRERG